MRRTHVFSTLAMAVGLLLLAITSCMAVIQVEVNGSPLSFNVPPTQMNGRTMVPLRGIFESLGAQVNWDASSRTIAASKGDTDVQLGIGNRSAVVNGRNVRLDAPAMILNGATMVPLRFVSEALGADVKWSSATQTVSISTDDGMAPIPSTTNQAFIIPGGTVIPVTLDKSLNSGSSRQGDAVTATVRSALDGDAEFPRGTKISGTVSEVERSANGQPGMLNLAFNRVILPDGHSYNTQGTLVSLDEKTVKQTSDGRLVMRSSNKNNQLKFIGIGALGGFVLGKLTKHTIEGTLLGAAAGYFYAQNDKKKNQPTDVSVAAGTEFGVELNQQMAYNPSRAFIVARGDYLSGRTSTSNPALDNIRVTSGGRAVDFTNAQPIDVDGVILVPLEPVMNRSNIAYKYDERLQAVTLDTDEGALQMNIGKSYALLNGERENLEAPAEVRNGVVYVPLHFLALATGTSVVWAADTRTVTMYNPT